MRLIGLALLVVLLCACDKSTDAKLSGASASQVMSMTDVMSLDKIDEWKAADAEKRFAGYQLSGSLDVVSTMSSQEQNVFTVWGTPGGHPRCDIEILCEFPWAEGRTLHLLKEGSAFNFTGVVSQITLTPNRITQVFLKNCTH